jgi:predicted kinase
MNEEKDLYLIRGIQGAGKTSFVDGVRRQEDVVVAQDDFMVNAQGKYIFDWERIEEVRDKCIGVVEDAMERSVQRIFVHNTFVKAEHLQPYFTLAKKHSYRAFSIVVENRHGNTDIHNVPKAIVENKRREFDVSL